MQMSEALRSAHAFHAQNLSLHTSANAIARVKKL
jgi:hypothetical protein